MLSLFLMALALGQVHSLPAAALEAAQHVSTPLFVKISNGSSETFQPYNPFDYQQWAPESSLYADAPMLEKQMTVDNQQVTYQDFNISAVSIEQFKEYFMGLPQFFDADGKFVPSAEEVKAYQYDWSTIGSVGRILLNPRFSASLIAHQESTDAMIQIPTHLAKRDFPDACFYDNSQRCASYCTNLISRGVLQSRNDNVYGYYHYVSDAQCGSGSISKTVSVTHVSGVTIGGSGTIPGFGKGWTKAISTFLSTFSLSVSHSPDSVSTAISYSGTCGPFNVCFLWERPHFRVDKGVIVTEHIDINSGRTCSAPTVTPYEAHIMHDNSDPGGASAHGICYSMGNHGCGSRIDASSTLQRCPNNY